MSKYTHKMVNGVLVSLTPEEIAQLEAQEIEAAQQSNIATPDPGYGPTIKATLVPTSGG